MGTSFAAVGLGTGPVGSISRRALQTLKEADEIFCPRSRNASRSLARERLAEIGSLPAEFIEYPLAMQEGGQPLREDYRNAANRIETSLDEDRSVAAVTVGDPSLYSTLGPLVQTLRESVPTDAIRTVPGISSVQFAASMLDRPLVQHDEQFALIPMLDSTDLRCVEQFETLAFTKVNRGFDRLWSRLDGTDRLGSSYLFERLGTQDERVRVLSDVSQSAEIPYFSLVLSFEENGSWD